jgi:hypothetical protein
LGTLGDPADLIAREAAITIKKRRGGFRGVFSLAVERYRFLPDVAEVE